MTDTHPRDVTGAEASGESTPSHDDLHTTTQLQMSPGDLLRQAREARGWSEAELAEIAKLPSGTVHALEADDFELLKEPVYVRGYYRKCALTLNADVDAIVGAYERKARPSAPPMPNKIPVISGGGQPFGRKLLRFVLMLLLLTLVLGAGWWLLQSPVTDGSGLLQSGEIDSANGAGAAITVRESASDQSLEPPAGASPAGATAPAPEAGPSTVEPGPEPAATSSRIVSDAAANPTLRAASAQGTANAGEGPSTAQAVLRFDSDSWLRVRGPDGSTLANEMVNAGERRTFTAGPPLEVFLGYAPGAQLQWRGEPVELSSVVRSNNTASVTLD